MHWVLIPMFIVLFFYGVFTGNTDHPFWVMSATLMAMIVAIIAVFFFALQFQ